VTGPGTATGTDGARPLRTATQVPADHPFDSPAPVGAVLGRTIAAGRDGPATVDRDATGGEPDARSGPGGER